ncbi:glycoside hydrolase family 19 protein [Flectobacillus longus]|uniref:glycoside hydrolase family 19 protein n=1 Tax=Flectobacillus longus TaxID=2984207 RepID=UPI0024B67707|nr:hypothetical protein [Flectobacillus longus]MDI9881128.1 hypothetical protein [Flectobacillus longus]
MGGFNQKPLFVLIPLGQISIGDICIDNFSLELLPHDASGVQVYSSKKDQYDDLAVKISDNSLIFNDYQSPTTKTLTLKTDNNEQTTLVEKWLFEKAKGGDVSITTQAKFPITGVQLKEIFTKTEQSRCDEVAMLINKYSNKYGIDNAEKMSHFIGQIGAETNLSQLKELTYTAKNIENSRFATTTRKYKGKKVIKYCDLFEGYDAISTDSCPFPYCEPPLYEGTTGLIVKSKYVKNTTLFDYVYACRMGNGTIDSKDGSRFKGRGFIQLTGYNNYKTMLQEKWDKVHGVGNKDFMCRSAECDKNLDMTAEDLDMAMQTALTFWADANANDFAGEVSNDAIKKVTYEINGGYNGLPERKLYTKKAYKTLKK